MAQGVNVKGIVLILAGFILRMGGSSIRSWRNTTIKYLAYSLGLPFAATISYAVEAPVPPDLLAEWLAFDKPVRLECRELPKPTKQERTPNPFGDPLWVQYYGSKTQTLHSYSIALFPGGTLFRGKRKQMEEGIARQVKELRAMAADAREGIAIQTRPDGRKVYFTVMGFGPGGTGYGAFTTLAGGAYDLLVTHEVDHEDDMPQEQKLKNPAKPRKELTDIFELIEKRVGKTIEKR